MILWILLIGAIIWYLSSYSNSRISFLGNKENIKQTPLVNENEEALKILSNRFAKGEIESEEYETKRKLLKRM